MYHVGKPYNDSNSPCSGVYFHSATAIIWTTKTNQCRSIRMWFFIFPLFFRSVLVFQNKNLGLWVTLMKEYPLGSHIPIQGQLVWEPPTGSMLKKSVNSFTQRHKLANFVFPLHSFIHSFVPSPCLFSWMKGEPSLNSREPTFSPLKVYLYNETFPAIECRAADEIFCFT